MRKDLFHSTSVKLAGFYVLIIMSISLLFSFWLYNVSLSEIRGSTRRQINDIQGRMSPNNRRFFLDELREIEDASVAYSRKRLIGQLLVINVGIGLSSVIVSYYLARRTLQPIEDSHKTLEQFTADASHELRTPLAVMKSENEVLAMQKKVTDSDARGLITSNIEEIDKMSELVEGLLQLARMSDSIEKTSNSTLEIANSALSNVQKLAEDKKIIIKCDKISDAKIKCDKLLVAQTLSILLKNAVSYSPPKSSVRLSGKVASKNYVFEVIDKGVGIKKADLDHVFDRFYRGDTSRSKEQNDGYGLGLAIAKKIVDLHNGDLSVKSTSGKGSTFTISLPI